VYVLPLLPLLDRTAGHTIQLNSGREITQHGHTFQFHDGGTYAVKSLGMLALLGKIYLQVTYKHAVDFFRHDSAPSRQW